LGIGGVRIKSLIKGVLHPFGYELPRASTALEPTDALLSHRTLLCAIQQSLKPHSGSKAQLLQDLFVLAALREKRNGFFVEFGAGDGVNLSNTYLLEKEFGWTGILAEPNRTFFPKLAVNRTCILDGRCIWSTTGELVSFTETAEFGELSTISEFAQCDRHNRTANGAIQYEVETISLNDLLADNHAPVDIDYLSIDTEGSELPILRAIDFNKWHFNVITAEHNHVESAREGIYALLTSHGYRRVMTDYSRFEDWYIRNGLVAS
jgi:FkbM family methyltransferase